MHHLDFFEKTMILGVQQLYLNERKPHNFFVGDKRNVHFKKEKEARLKVISAFMLPFSYRRALDGAKGQSDRAILLVPNKRQIKELFWVLIK